MTSRAERKRRKKKFISLAGGRQVEQKPTGRDRTQTYGPKENADVVAMNARIRQLGSCLTKDEIAAERAKLDAAIKIDDEAERIAALKSVAASIRKKQARVARSPMAGCVAGRQLIADSMGSKEREALWEAVCHIRRTWVNYGRAIGAPNRYAQCLRILLPAEPFMVSPSTPFDDRPQEERDRAAVSAYMATEGWLMRGPSSDKTACIGAVVDDQPGHDWQAVKRALWLVVDGLSGARA